MGGGVDRLPGCHALPERGAPHRRPDRRADPAAPQVHDRGRGCHARRRAARACGAAHLTRGRLSARAVRRPAAAGDDRDGARLRSAADRRGRADDGARCDDPGADPPADRAAGRRAEHQSADDQPRSGSAGRHLRPPRGDVRGPGRRGGPGPGGVRGGGASVRAGSVRRLPRIGDPASRRAPRGLPGDPPDPAALPGGCTFHPRCPVAVEACAEEDQLLAVAGEDHRAACVHVGTAPEAVVRSQS